MIGLIKEVTEKVIDNSATAMIIQIYFLIYTHRLLTNTLVERALLYFSSAIDLPGPLGPCPIILHLLQEHQYLDTLPYFQPLEDVDT